MVLGCCGIGAFPPLPGMGGPLSFSFALDSPLMGIIGFQKLGTLGILFFLELSRNLISSLLTLSSFLGIYSLLKFGVFSLGISSYYFLTLSMMLL
jgi:hypothetical protein